MLKSRVLKHGHIAWLHISLETDQGLSQVSSETIGATGLAGRYATALFELAEADKKLDKVAEDLNALRSMIVESADFARLIYSPVISRADQNSAMSALTKKADMDELTTRFVGVLAQNRRLFALSGMIDAYQHLLSASRGEVSAEVFSAKELSDKQLKAVKDELKSAVGTDVSLAATVDEGLLGGLIVKIGSRMVDSSLRTKLQQLRLSMKGVG